MLLSKATYSWLDKAGDNLPWSNVRLGVLLKGPIASLILLCLHWGLNHKPSGSQSCTLSSRLSKVVKDFGTVLYIALLLFCVFSLPPLGLFFRWTQGAQYLEETREEIRKLATQGRGQGCSRRVVPMETDGSSSAADCWWRRGVRADRTLGGGASGFIRHLQRTAFVVDRLWIWL